MRIITVNRWPIAARSRAPAAPGERVLRALLAITCIFLPVTVGAGERGRREGSEVRTILDDFDVTRHSVPVERLISRGPRRDGIPAIDRPRFVAAREATFLAEDDLVIGFSYDGESRAYPLRILTWHELVNDQVGGRPILVSFCPLTASGVVFGRELGGATLSFGVSGKLYESNMLMYDRGTRSLWSQLAGAAVAGPMTGTALEPLPARRTTWARWRASHPDTLVLSTDTGERRDYGRDPYASYALSANLMFAPSRRDPRVQDKELVLGVTIDGVSMAYPFVELEAAATDTMIDRVAERNVSVHFETVGAWAESDGTILNATVAYWFAWSAFHPDTAVWAAVGPHEPAATDLAAGSARVVITKTDSYWTSLGGGFTIDIGEENRTNSGLFVVSGMLRNASPEPVRRVHLEFQLLDADGAAVYVERGVNRLAEETVGMSDSELVAASPEANGTIAPGADDAYRMIFIGSEIPKFHHARVTVVSVQ